VFFFYEIYDDEDAYVGHGEAIPLLESRERRFYVTVD
jgi:hypothetical protein